MEQRIVIAPDSYKDSISAVNVASLVAEELAGTFEDRDWTFIQHPLADGGEGTVEAFVNAHDGQYRQTEVTDPVGRPVTARWGEFDDDFAVIEMAEASGYELLDQDDQDPLRATTYGTGELIRQALTEGKKTIYVGMGGSATVDGGLGMARALGFECLDGNGNPVEKPEELEQMQEVKKKNVPESLNEASIIACSDVDNPLLGEDGAARVFAPQKGADATMVDRLEKCLNTWANCVEEFIDRSVRDEPGAGAAGGLGFGLAALLDSEIRPGAECIMDETGFNSVVKDADVLITGEGSMDRQSLRGKTPVAVARRAQDYDVDLIFGLAGQLSGEYEALYPLFDFLLSTVKRPVDLSDHLEQFEDPLRSTVRDIGRILCLLDRG